jgi:SAM-dependent methyltransferase
VEEYWEQWIVNTKPFSSVKQHQRYLEWRFRQYPLFRELMDLYGSHEGHVVLDYGCGPGDDLVGFLHTGRAGKAIGMDVSQKALDLAAAKLKLYGFGPERAELIKVSDSDPRVPLPDASVDCIYSEGVLHHVSRPLEVLRELARVARPGARMCVMVYSRDSLWLHLFVAYQVQVLLGAFRGKTALEAFPFTTDGPRCPIARCWGPEEFLALAGAAGWGKGTFEGGYLSRHELKCYRWFGWRAVRSRKLGEEHRAFLRALVRGPGGCPTYRGRYAGIGGVYKFARPAEA